MNWEQIRGRWLDYRAQIRQRWGTLSEQDLTTIAGRRGVLAGKLLERPGTTEEQIEREIAEFETFCHAVEESVGPGMAGLPAHRRSVTDG